MALQRVQLKNAQKETKNAKPTNKEAKIVHANADLHWFSSEKRAFGTILQLEKLEVSIHAEFHAKVGCNFNFYVNSVEFEIFCKKKLIRSN